MPSGSKKRKAAKKKKEQATNNTNSSTNNNPHGNGDQRSQDERESDGGDVGSPASQGDPNHQHPFNQREEEGKRGASPVQSHVTEDKSVEEANRDAESSEILRSDDVFAVKVEDESGPKEDLETTLVAIRHIKHEKSSSSSSSRSSSDDESQATQKNSKEEAYNFVSEATAYGNEDKLATVTSEEVLKLVENEAVGNVDSNSAVETANVDNLVKSGLYVPEELDHAAEVSANKSVSVVVEPGLKESEEKLLPSSNGVSQVELGENEGKNVSSSATSTAESSTVVENPQHLESHDHSEKQPLVASTPPVVQRTSLFSCCGLLDVLTGSGR
ncbi:hypothetical protein ERO13_D05G154000v2 [Gossypium hirsutum]|uniref:Uncharacterized protein n=5 Tax=Gossypium TaxID=3633 RepID=A0A5D2UX93_GOSMU|nr:uncharacterized protein LOC107905852 [Gossypium hirsutum]KAB2029371.1 hypothetical protein ES319_D05G157700v1 [Gossypium barbadense]TYG68601.1 hypothetical protein ES288_D05G165900v1 [Gossypium darwinii]TYH71172.1 hypothetical protein ES332_D05G166600v1 [Gossypium tomentosum]TYI81590.1 hypothetical protein E1A91_D05G163700v1 [Gossypium mustelinum]KAG4146384.1 hypothetical protein ERO13_D05G154000v2 [Gossypium hirsutum]